MIAEQVGFRESKFQSTFPRGERREHSEMPLSSTQFQSTFPRGERRASAYKLYNFLFVSIHVPTRGTTYGFQNGANYSGVSIHVPTRGTTRSGDLLHCGGSCFNPRSHEGNDESCKHRRLQQRRFNPRSHEGNDSNYL